MKKLRCFTCNSFYNETHDLLRKKGFNKLIKLATEGLVVQYENKQDIKTILQTIIKIDKRNQDLGDITLEEITKYSRIPFNYLNMNKIKEYFKEI